ncbi:MAG: DUF3800 domain-containing protein [Kiloniellales bacterium]
MIFPHLGPQAFGGGPLEGDRIMRLVYVDEAGLSNASQEPFLIVAGTIVDADKKLVEVERHLDKLVARHIPAGQQDDFVFHAKELFNGGGKVFKRDDWPLKQRLKIADDLAAIPRRFRLPIALGIVDRATFPKTFKFPENAKQREITVAAHSAAFMSCAINVEHWMRKNTENEVCLMVVEDNDQARKAIRDIQNYYQDPKIRDELDERARIHFPFRKIKEDPLFQSKRKSSVLQLADFCAYVTKKRFMNDSRYDRFFEAMMEQIVLFEEFLPGRSS